MGVATQQQTEVSMSSLAIDLRSVRQQDREFVVRDRGSSLFNIVNAVVMGIIYAGEIDALVAAHDGLALVEQHPDPYLLQSWNHADRVMIAQYPVNRAFEMRSDLRHPFESCIEWTEGLAAVIPGQNTEVVRNAIQKLDQAAHRALTYVRMHVADVEDGESIKRAGNVRPVDEVVADLYTLCILGPAPIQPGQLQ